MRQTSNHKQKRDAMAERQTISTPDGDFSAYVARPTGAAPAPAIVVIQEIFGVNRFVRKVADDLAAAGYLAIAPDLFWRIEPDIDITDETGAEWKQAFALFNAFDFDKGVEDIQATIDRIRKDKGCNGKVGAVGYCLGGRLAYATAARTDADASASYYGVMIDALLGEKDKITKPLMLHIAAEDGFVPKEAQAAIIEGLKGKANVEIHVYPGRDHAFAREKGQHYDAADAALANGRTRDFFKRTIG